LYVVSYSAYLAHVTRNKIIKIK